MIKNWKLVESWRQQLMKMQPAADAAIDECVNHIAATKPYPSGSVHPHSNAADGNVQTHAVIKITDGQQSECQTHAMSQNCYSLQKCHRNKASFATSSKVIKLSYQPFFKCLPKMLLICLAIILT